MSIPMETVPQTKQALHLQLQKEMAAFTGRVQVIPYVGDPPFRPQITIMPLSIGSNTCRGY